MNPTLNWLAALLLASTTILAPAQKKPRILIGISNVVDMGDPEKHQAKNNLWEVAPAFLVFRIHGFEVDFVSPNGGKVPFSLEVDEFDPPGMVNYAIKYEGFREKRQTAP